MKKRTTSKNLEVSRHMPPLFHTIPGQSFDIKKSEVINWLINQPDILNYVWNNIKNSDGVIYDPATGKWQGVDYEN